MSSNYDITSCRFLKNLNVIVLTLWESIPAIGAIVITISLVLCESTMMMSCCYLYQRPF